MTRSHPHLIPLLLPALLLVAPLLPGCDTPTRPEFDWTGLLTDEELLTEEDPNAPDEDPAWAEWIERNNIPIRSLEAENFSDLKSLIPYLRGKRIVQLGESGHGVAEFNKIKVRLIKFLHEVLRFDVIAFESSIFECFYADQNASELTAVQTMTNSIFSVWHTAEVSQLFEYLKEQRDTRRPLNLAGFDIQLSSSSGSLHRPAFFRQAIARIDSGFADRVKKLDSEFVIKHRQQDYILSNKESLISQYYEIVDFFDRHKEEFLLEFAEQPEIPLIARQAAWSTVEYIKELQALYTGEFGMVVEVRDKGMAENISFLANELYPQARIIVWAHNSHVCHDGLSIPGSFGNSMGRWVVDWFRPELHTIGLYMYRGRAALNNREIYEITPARSGSVESVFYRTKRKHCFVDMLGRRQNEDNSWMFERVYAKSWGRSDMLLVPRDQYDAILFIDTVSPPAYVAGSHFDGGCVKPPQLPAPLGLQWPWDGNGRNPPGGPRTWGSIP